MKPDQIREAQRELGLSDNKFARAIGVSDGALVRKWKAGKVNTSGPVRTLIRYLLKFGVQDDLSEPR